MIDLLLVNTLINLIWYIFTMIFLLYRFTSFFSYAVNFIKFCGKLFSGMYYIGELSYNYIKQTTILPPQPKLETSLIDIIIDESENTNTNTNTNTPVIKTFIQKTKEKISKYYNYCYSKITGLNLQSNSIQIYETSESSIINKIPVPNVTNTVSNVDLEKQIFNNQLSELCNQISSFEFDSKINMTNLNSVLEPNQSPKIQNNLSYIPIFQSVEIQPVTRSIHQPNTRTIHPLPKTIQQIKKQNSIKPYLYKKRKFNNSHLSFPSNLLFDSNVIRNYISDSKSDSDEMFSVTSKQKSSSSESSSSDSSSSESIT